MTLFDVFFYTVFLICKNIELLPKMSTLFLYTLNFKLQTKLAQESDIYLLISGIHQQQLKQCYSQVLPNCLVWSNKHNQQVQNTSTAHYTSTKSFCTRIYEYAIMRNMSSTFALYTVTCLLTCQPNTYPTQKYGDNQSQSNTSEQVELHLVKQQCYIKQQHKQCC